MTGGLFGPSGPTLWAFVRWRTVGAIVCIGFGTYSLYSFIATTIWEKKEWFGGLGLITLVLVAWSITQLRAMRHRPRSAPRRRSVRSYNIWFPTIIATEVIGIVLGGPVLAHFHRSDLYPNWVDAIVGLHFLPLGKIFNLPIYYATGGAILSAAFGSMLVPGYPLRMGICSGGTGLALWLTGGLILLNNRSSLLHKAQQL